MSLDRNLFRLKLDEAWPGLLSVIVLGYGADVRVAALVVGNCLYGTQFRSTYILEFYDTAVQSWNAAIEAAGSGAVVGSVHEARALAQLFYAYATGRTVDEGNYTRLTEAASYDMTTWSLEGRWRGRRVAVVLDSNAFVLDFVIR